ncbi:hypothetical protein [Methanolobus sp.]|jgi:hypothetical protein|nr:hypothetical protein [Methanolobus sp.]
MKAAEQIKKVADEIKNVNLESNDNLKKITPDDHLNTAGLESNKQ